MNILRREKLKEFIRQKQVVSLKQLTQEFNDVSVMTLHRDLDYLAKEGFILRIRGGAKYLETEPKGEGIEVQDISNKSQKDIVAQKAVRFVKEGASWILRIIIDKENEPVSINDCVDLSRRMSTLLDEVDPIPQSYCLEVTSPGANRELTRPEHFDYYEGWAVAVKLYRPQDGMREFAGLLRGLENQVLTIEEEDGTLRSFDKKEVSCVHAIEDWDDGIEDDDGLDDDGNSLEI